MMDVKRRGDFDSEIHDERELWVCQCCDAHLHVDAVGDTCPRCGEPTLDSNDD